jgi:hypothetical protein
MMNEEFQQRQYEEEAKQRYLTDNPDEVIKPAQTQVSRDELAAREAQLKASINYDEQVIPTLNKQHNKNSAEEGGDPGTEGEEGKVEEISPGNMKYAEALIPVFGEDVVKKMFSRPWAVREEGLKECEEHIRNNGDD